jgi:alpha-1,2-mannosyltransferase
VLARPQAGPFATCRQVLLQVRRMKPLIAALQLSPRTRRLLIGFTCVAIALDLGKLAHRRMSLGGDFDVAREFGRRFLQGEYLYAHGLHFVYLPSAAMYFSPLALLPSAIGFAAWFGIAILCLWLTLRMWQRVISVHNATVAQHGFVIGLGTVFLASHFIVRDLDDGGPHTILLAILTAGIYSLFKQRKWMGAIWLGLATAIKVTPGLFVPFLLWKRQWRLAAYAALASAFWIALPIVRMGPASWYGDMRAWGISAVGFATPRDAASSLGSEKVIHNQSFHAAVLYLAEKSSLSPQVANGIAIVATTGIVVLFGWITRHRYTSLEDSAWPSEASALLVLMVLLSPITWEQHLVLMIPALYLITAEGVGTPGLGGGILGIMILFILLSLVLTRDLLGKERYAVLLGYHVQTISTVIVFSIALLRQPPRPSVEAFP